MPSPREPILVRYLEIAQGVTGFKTKKRNGGLIDDDKRDAVILLDGDEINNKGPAVKPRAGLMMPAFMRASPELYIVLKEHRPQNDTPANVGTLLNAYRDALIKAVAEDTAMAALLGSNGSVVYNGCATDLKSGSALSGTMRLDFSFYYWVIPSAI